MTQRNPKLPPPATDHRTAQPAGGGLEHSAHSGLQEAIVSEKPLILYVEDNELEPTLMKRVLEYRGYRVEMAEDGPTGFAAARALKPALILMDLGIPGTDGYETTRLIKADPESAPSR